MVGQSSRMLRILTTAMALAAAISGSGPSWTSPPTPASTATPTPTTGQTAPPAGVIAGNDVSWPQCPIALGGYANPMPAADARFVVIGISRGQAFTTNPCLQTELAWARNRHLLVAGYVFPTYPSNAQYAAYGATGPYPVSTVTGRLMNVGYQQAGYWLQVIRATGFATPMVWVDVELSKRGPRWTARPADRNLPVIRGVLAGLEHAGYRTGIYTTSSHWAQITGGVRLGRPEWRTVGRGATPARALAGCGWPGNQGSPVLMAQYFTADDDFDVLCPIMNSAVLPRYFSRY